MQDPALFNFSATANIPGALVLTLDPPPEVDLAGCTVRAAVLCPEHVAGCWIAAPSIPETSLPSIFPDFPTDGLFMTCS